ncbi:hypothetical protein EYF80_012754 [Liparis tanakae]|uniref:Uncharacterized protein n=1 Tax=Liparis tanakae TaxID=230148 RepID=A0A4Z2IGI3_9TELE|nr:hypothetical protein EYF80_012754 [Liparis tanakae]
MRTGQLAEHESIASASGISHSPVTLPQLSLPPVKGRGVSGPAEGERFMAALWAKRPEDVVGYRPASRSFSPALDFPTHLIPERLQASGCKLLQSAGVK